ncbi:hypothetical protein HOD38_02955 [archaeon]|jgi:hypothetical protein|nr:hypothetical protein [archaeon]MBT4397201.1 hypothetical protein [archaeon]MBT4440581.1 hypothetical protein [archaeon]
MVNIILKKIVKNKKTYPSWSTGSTYFLESKEKEENIEIYYKTKSNRKISRIFPKKLNLTPKLAYALGFIKGEGANALGKSNYRRFTLTNADPKIMLFVLKELDKNNLLKISNLKREAIHLLHHNKSDSEVINYWSRNLNLPKKLFKCFEDKNKTSDYGVCHVYVSDVLLRRVIDLIHEKFL